MLNVGAAGNDCRPFIGRVALFSWHALRDRDQYVDKGTRCARWTAFNSQILRDKRLDVARRGFVAAADSDVDVHHN